MMKAIRRLFKQHATEKSFGWYAPDPEWRRTLRELYPVEWVAAHHRDDITDEARRLHFNRFQLTIRTIPREDLEEVA